jgi:hypothetical protein
MQYAYDEAEHLSSSLTTGKAAPKLRVDLAGHLISDSYTDSGRYWLT